MTYDTGQARWSLAADSQAVASRLEAAFNPGAEYPLFTVQVARPAKHAARAIKVSWAVFPFEEDVLEALGDLGAGVVLDRVRMWSCGRFHTNAHQAWQDHEGAQYLVADDHSCGLGEDVLPEDVEERLRAEGNTLESQQCTPGNYATCPTCGGGAHYIPGSVSRGYVPCPDCINLGTDRQLFPGILDLDDPAHRDFYQVSLDRRHADLRSRAARQQAQETAAQALPTTHAAAHWTPLPSRAAGLLNGLPVATSVGCDYLLRASTPTARAVCREEARWFDPSTGLRVCTRHRRTPALNGPLSSTPTAVTPSTVQGSIHGDG